MEIPILESCDNPEENPLWTEFYGHLAHPNLHHPVFFRHNLSSVNLFNSYYGGTVYLIGRGPSLRQNLENSKIKDLLFHPSVVKYTMNSAADVLDNHTNIWSGVDELTKFSPTIYKNPNILKLVPLNRFRLMNHNTRDPQIKKTTAYKDEHKIVYAPHVPNLYGVQTFLLSKGDAGKVSFGNAFLSSPAALFGHHAKHKSVLLFALKMCLLLGFSRIVLLGVDFEMSKVEPYYNVTSGQYNEFHVQHNNNLYTCLAPLIREIFDLLENDKSGYRCKIRSATKINNLSFIPTVNLKDELACEIERKTR